MSRSYTLKTTCDRCSGVEESALDGAPLGMADKPPAVQVLINGVVDVEYGDLCSKCPGVVQNYADRIARRSVKKTEPEPAPLEPGPNGLRWVDGIKAWVVGEWKEGESRVGTRNYSHVEVNERTTVIPELEGITDLEEARELIDAAAGEQSDR